MACTFPDCKCPVTMRGCLKEAALENMVLIQVQRRREHPTFALLAIIGAAILYLLWTLSQALSSDMNYCRPYADQFSKKFQQYVWNRAYSTCLNSYGDPVVPKSWKEATDIVNGDEIDYTGLVGETPATAAIATPEPTLGTKIEDLRKTRWRASCARAFRTWDAKTETVVRKRRGRRVTCPCGTTLVCK